MSTETKRTTTKSAAANELDATRPWALSELEGVVPTGNRADLDQVRSMLVKTNRADEFAELGSSYRTEDILQAVPGFLVSVLKQTRRLPASDVIIGYSPELTRLLLEEALALEATNSRYEDETMRVMSGSQARRATAKQANSKGLRLRRQVARVLESLALPASAGERAALARATEATKSPPETAASVRAVADVLERVRAGESDEGRAVLERLGLGADQVATMRAVADEIRLVGANAARPTTPQDTDQRTLDLQDGIVLAVMRIIWTAFRDAREEGVAVVPPRLGASLERLVGGAREVAQAPQEEEVPEGAPPATPQA